MNQQLPPLRCELLRTDHLLMDFDCGRDSPLTDWLINKSLLYQEERLCSVWVLVTDDGVESVRGYFTLAAHAIAVSDVPRRHRTRNKSNGAIVGSLPQVPAQLLGKFAVDVSLQGTVAGKFLMMNVFDKFSEASTISGSKYLVLETSEPQLKDYYHREYGFVELRGGNADRLTRMYKRSDDIDVDLNRIEQNSE